MGQAHIPNTIDGDTMGTNYQGCGGARRLSCRVQRPHLLEIWYMDPGGRSPGLDPKKAQIFTITDRRSKQRQSERHYALNVRFARGTYV